MHTNLTYLQEFSGEHLVGVLLQELAVEAAEAKVTNDTGTVLRFETVLQDTKPNRNKRLYSETVLREAIMAPPVQERLRVRAMLGELNHPFTTEMSRQMVVDMTRCSHIITELSAPKNGVVRGSIETAATAAGRDARGLIVENKMNPAFSMRGMGGVRRVPGKDLMEVTSPLALVTYDLVTYPSHQAAYADVNRPVMEGMSPVSVREATSYVRDQSRNVRALVEQFEMDGVEVSLTGDQQDAILRSGQTIVRAFLEPDIRAAFRSAIRF